MPSLGTKFVSKIPTVKLQKFQTVVENISVISSNSSSSSGSCGTPCIHISSPSSRFTGDTLDKRRTERSGTYIEIMRILRSEGIRGLYRGLLPEVLKVTPMVAITFCIYELVLGYLPNE